MNLESRKIVDTIVECAFDKKGYDIVVMDMEGVTILCDYFVIVSGTSRPHTRAIAEHVEIMLKEKLGISDKKIQGKQDAGWILMDYGTVVVHLFLEHLREYYDLEELWSNAGLERPEPEFTPNK